MHRHITIEMILRFMVLLLTPFSFPHSVVISLSYYQSALYCKQKTNFWNIFPKNRNLCSASVCDTRMTHKNPHPAIDSAGSRIERAMEITLQFFHAALADTDPRALREIRSGRKQRHWMWYIFP
jgi:hypothetical protein